MVPTFSLLFILWFGGMWNRCHSLLADKSRNKGDRLYCMASMDPVNTKKSPKWNKKSRSQTHIFESFGVKKYFHSLWIGSNFILYMFKTKIILNFVIFVATENGSTTKFSPSSFVAVGYGIQDSRSRTPGSGIWDPGSEILNLRSGMDKIRIRNKHPGSAALAVNIVSIHKPTMHPFE